MPYDIGGNSDDPVAPERGQGGKGGVCPPMLKKRAFVILPNSMRKLGGGGIHLRCEKIIHTKYFQCDSSFLYGLFIMGLLFRAQQSTFHRFLL